MVSKGQFSERPTLIPSGGVILEGLWHRGQRRPPLLIVPPLPEEGGGMDHIAATEVAWASAMAGFPSIRFNFRGVGASQGSISGLASCLEDIEAAARLLAENAGGREGARLYLGGSAAAALERPKGGLGICLISPAGVDPSGLADLGRPLLVIRGEEDRRLPSRPLAQAISRAGGLLELIPAADHAFLRNLPEVGRAVVRWLETLEGDQTGGSRLAKEAAAKGMAGQE